MIVSVVLTVKARHINRQQTDSHFIDSKLTVTLSNADLGSYEYYQLINWYSLRPRLSSAHIFCRTVSSC